MVNYYIQRVGQAVVTLVTVVTFAFALFRLLPGGPMAYLKAQVAAERTGSQGSAGQASGGSSDISTDQFASLAESYTGVNPNEPLHIAYIDYVSQLATGSMGKSIWFKDPVADILSEALPWTLFIMIGASLITFASGIVLGAFMAYYEGSRFDSVATVGSIIIHSIPFFIVAVIFMSLFYYELGWLPRGGRYDASTTPGLNFPFIASAIKHAILPTLAAVTVGFGSGALSMRGNSIRILGSDYIRVAKLRGLPTSRIGLRYVMRNAILPMYTGFMISLGSLFGGAVILERIFSYPGIGYYTIEAYVARDYPLMMGGFILTTTVVVIGILIADLTYGLIDPRVEVGDGRETY